MGEESEAGRLSVPAAEEILGKEFPVLDHGFVRLVDYMGGDDSIVQAARVSYGKGTKKISEDRGLIRYLMRHRHTTPFEMVELKFHAKMPIFVARHWIRHRTASVNEYSLRYSEPENEFYIPKPEEVRFQSVTNRQGSSEEKVSEETAQKVIDFLSSTSEDSMGKYQSMNKDNIARELARIGLPINIYTQWYWKIDLHNLFHFLSLRADPHAQWEIREYAKIMGEITRSVAPNAYESFQDYVLNSINFSGPEMQAMKQILSGVNLSELESLAKGFPTKREGIEFLEKMKVFQGALNPPS